MAVSLASCSWSWAPGETPDYRPIPACIIARAVAHLRGVGVPLRLRTHVETGNKHVDAPFPPSLFADNGPSRCIPTRTLPIDGPFRASAITRSLPPLRRRCERRFSAPGKANEIRAIAAQNRVEGGPGKNSGPLRILFPRGCGVFFALDTCRTSRSMLNGVSFAGLPVDTTSWLSGMRLHQT